MLGWSLWSSGLHGKGSGGNSAIWHGGFQISRSGDLFSLYSLSLWVYTSFSVISVRSDKEKKYVMNSIDHLELKVLYYISDN